MTVVGISERFYLTISGNSMLRSRVSEVAPLGLL